MVEVTVVVRCPLSFRKLHRTSTEHRGRRILGTQVKQRSPNILKQCSNQRRKESIYAGRTIFMSNIVSNSYQHLTSIPAALTKLIDRDRIIEKTEEGRSALGTGSAEAGPIPQWLLAYSQVLLAISSGSSVLHLNPPDLNPSKSSHNDSLISKNRLHHHINSLWFVSSADVVVNNLLLTLLSLPDLQTIPGVVHRTALTKIMEFD